MLSKSFNIFLFIDMCVCMLVYMCDEYNYCILHVSYLWISARVVFY